MSKTRRGHKSPDHEYWSRRPFNRSGQLPGPFAKKRTHKAERQKSEAEIELGLQEMNANLREPCPCCHGYCGLDLWSCEEEQMALEYFFQLEDMGMDYD